MSVKEKLMAILGITEEQYEEEMARTEYEREKAMGCVGDYITGRAGQMATNWGVAQQAVDLQQLRLAQQQAMMNNATAQMSGLSGLAQGGYVSQQATKPVKKTFATIHGGLSVPTFEELDDPDSAFNLPLDALSVMWGARFGYRWVKDEDTAAAIEENENLWIMTLKRLSDAGRIECQQFRHPAQLGYDTAWKLKE